MKWILFGIVFGLVLAVQPSVVLAAGDCSSVREQLGAMREAQRTLLSSLADNHETFALSLEETSDELAASSGPVAPRALKSLRKTARAFRDRGLAAKRQSAKLDTATAALIEQVLVCLRERR